MRKTQPFFLQVSPPKSLYWPSSPDEHPPRHHCPIAATAERWGSALLQDQGSLAVLAHSTTPSALSEDPSPRKTAFPQKSCYSRHSAWIPPHLLAHRPWVWTYSYGNGLFQLETGHLETPREGFGSQKALSRDRQQKSSCLSDYWTVHTRQVSLFPLISPMEFQENRLWPLE